MRVGCLVMNGASLMKWGNHKYSMFGLTIAPIKKLVSIGLVHNYTKKEV